jgi:hypothetical protein
MARKIAKAILRVFAAGRRKGIVAESPQDLHWLVAILLLQNRCSPMHPGQIRGLGRPVLRKEHLQNRFAIFQVCFYGLI